MKELQTSCKNLYQKLIDKEQNGDISLRDLMLEVKYFQAPSTIFIKEQTITDAAYQFVLYLLEIYKNKDPLQNLQNNILFVFNNNIPIAEQF
jgi:hypothetical protein